MRIGGRLLVAVMALALSLTGAEPASAHSCAEPVTIVAGEETTVQLAITGGTEPSRDITFDLGDFEVVDAAEARGWEVEKGPSSVRYVGGPLEPETCVPFEMVIRADRAGALRVRALQRLEDGRVVEHPAEGDIFVDDTGGSVQVNRSGPPNPLFEQVIYVTAEPQDSSARTPLLVATAVVAIVVLVLVIQRTRRSRHPAT